MTFIASVKAKKGVAVIADSLVTSNKRIIEESDFRRLLEEKQKILKSADQINLSDKEISGLFKIVHSHTTDFENKLIKYDKYTAVTTSGKAFINDQNIEEFLLKIIKKNSNKKNYKRKGIKTKIKELCDSITLEVKLHIKKYSLIYTIVFIITHFDPKTYKTIIYRITVLASTKDDLKDSNHKYIDCKMTDEFEKVVYDGQSAISEGILFGDFFTVYFLVPKIAKKIFSDLKIDESSLPKNYIDKLRKDDSITTKSVIEGMKMFKLKTLSLQQAVDLAWLLMSVEIAFQKYTEDIPTVGGVIKLAVIDQNGFRFITGDSVIKPKSL